MNAKKLLDLTPIQKKFNEYKVTVAQYPKDKGAKIHNKKVENFQEQINEFKKIVKVIVLREEKKESLISSIPITPVMVKQFATHKKGGILQDLDNIKAQLQVKMDDVSAQLKKYDKEYDDKLGDKNDPDMKAIE